MLYTLHGYILRELGKVFAIAAASLTVILSLGGLLQPLRHHGVSAVQLFQLLLYFFPVMLTFSLPVAALLAATLVYGRLSADNELTACRASGISMWTLLVPGLVVGVAVMAANLLLSNWFIPRCARGAAELVRQDIQDFALNRLRSDKLLTYERWIVAAQQVEKLDGEPPRILLVAPSMAQVSKGQLQERVWCRSAILEFDQVNNKVTVLPDSAVAMSGQEPNAPARVLSQPLRWPIQSILRDDVGFKSYGELNQLRANPEPFFRVRKELDKCRRLTEQKLLFDEIAQAVKPRDGGPAGYRMQYEDFEASPPALREAIVEAVSARAAPKGRLLLGQPTPGEPGEPLEGVTVTLMGPASEDRPARPAVVYRARQAELTAYNRETEAGSMVDVSFPGRFSRQTVGAASLPAEKSNQKMVERLLPPAGLVDRVGAMSRGELEATEQMRKNVNREIDRLQREIVAELHSRGAFSVAGLVLVMLGAALGVVFRSGHVLVAFGVAAVPAMFAITMVIMGNKVATSRGSLQQMGVLFIWSGNLVIVALNAWVYARLLKH